MESIYTELALYGSKNECDQTDAVFLPISEVCDGTVSHTKLSNWPTTCVAAKSSCKCVNLSSQNSNCVNYQSYGT